MRLQRITKLIIGIVATLFPFAAYADLRITEVMYDPDGSDTKKEWIEVFNEGPYLVDLAPVKFADKSGHILNVPPKNGGTGTMTIVPGAYVILASDATTFHTAYPNVNQVIDTTMSLNNTGASIGIGTSNGPLARATYDSSMGGTKGESLQWYDGTWIHAAPTPGRENAKVSTLPAPVVTAAPVSKKVKAVAQGAPQTKTPKVKTTKAKAETETLTDDPLDIVNATPSESAAQVAAAGSLGGYSWWFAAAALAISTGAAASMISRSKKKEWTIEESE